MTGSATRDLEDAGQSCQVLAGTSREIYPAVLADIVRPLAFGLTQFGPHLADQRAVLRKAPSNSNLVAMLGILS